MDADLDGLVPAIASGDTEAFGRWVAGAEERLRASLQRLTTRLDVEALVQETLLRVWQVTPRFRDDGRPNGLLRLALRIARNLALSELRRLRAHPLEITELERALVNAERTAEPTRADPLLRRLIELCRARLPRRPALALSARLESGGAQPDRSLAAQLGMRPNTFLQNVTRARRLLSACLEEHGVKLEVEIG